MARASIYRPRTATGGSGAWVPSVGMTPRSSLGRRLRACPDLYVKKMRSMDVHRSFCLSTTLRTRYVPPRATSRRCRPVEELERDGRHVANSYKSWTYHVCVASYGEVTGISRHPACLSAPREAPQQRVSGSHLDQLRNSSGSHCRPNIGRPTVYPGRP